MEPPLFRSVDNASLIEHLYHRPDELIGFADLLLRWSSLSFFKVPFFTIMRRVGDDFGFYLHLYEAKSIAFSDALPEGVSQETKESPYAEDGTQKSRRKNAKPRQKTEAELEADRMYIYLRFQPPLLFRSRYEHLYANFCRLYFLRSEVEAIEKTHPECRISAPPRKDPDGRFDGLYTTTEKNISEVAHIVLLRMVSGPEMPVQHSNTFRDGLLCPESGMWWNHKGTMNKERVNSSFPISPLPSFPPGNIWPDVPVIMPENPKKSRTTKLAAIWPKIAVLKRLGVREQDKMAKIIYALHPFLTDEEIGKLFPAKQGAITSPETNRDRGRILLGKRKPRKPAQGKPKTST
jgi:hypothetical protein